MMTIQNCNYFKKKKKTLQLFVKVSNCVKKNTYYKGRGGSLCLQKAEGLHYCSRRRELSSPFKSIGIAHQ